jgi:hypothetical protein
MKALLIALSVVAATATVAAAGTTCQRIGSFTYCSDDSGRTVTCQRIGSYTYCN